MKKPWHGGEYEQEADSTQDIPGRLRASRLRRDERHAPRLVFRDGRNRNRFLHTLNAVGERCGWSIYARVSLSKHHHWLLATLEPKLERKMQSHG